MLTAQRKAASDRPHLLPARPRVARCCRAHPPRGTRLRPRVAAPQRDDAAPTAVADTRSHEPHQPARPPQPVDSAYAPITSMWSRLASEHGDLVAMEDPHRLPGTQITYRELHQQILRFGAGLKALGLDSGERVCLFAENSCRWIVADQGVMANGAADAVRGSSAPAEELHFILRHSGASALILQDSEALDKVVPFLGQPDAPHLKCVVLLWPDAARATAQAAALPPGVPLLGFEEVLAQGAALMVVGSYAPAACAEGDLATLVYTSGTTGHPKGVMLSHGNLAFQVARLSQFLSVLPGESTLALLPPWHIYQRSVSNYVFSCAAKQVFTNVRKFRDDLTRHPPDHLVCVPLVLDTLHSKVMTKLAAETGVKALVVRALLAASEAYVRAARVAGGRCLSYARAPPPPLVALWAGVAAALLRPLQALASRLVFSKVRTALGVRRTLVSGGGSLAAHLDLFFEQVGITVLNGYGLTETSPVLACRSADERANVRGTIGRPIAHTSVRIVHPETHAPLPDGQQGLLLVRGPGVMQGYFADESSTREAFIDGWFNTGDLGWRAPEGVPGSAMGGCLVLTGRAKDTIVLSSGKNIEPQPIEDAVQCSPFIKHVILVGQDKRELGALVFPDVDALAARAAAAAAPATSTAAASTATASAAAAANGGGAGASAAPGGGDDVAALLAAEVAAFNSARPDYHREDRIAHIQVVPHPLSAEDGTLTRTLKPRRVAIFATYADEVAALLRRLRG